MCFSMEVGSVNLSASDPWKGHGCFLTLENHRPDANEISPPGQEVTTTITGKDILLSLSKILKKWPGEETVILSDEARHLRFVLAVAGYPEIEVATRPLDWPLHPSSIDALRVSKQLDSIVGATEGTSLRSSILNRDFNYRNPINNSGDLVKAHSSCLSLLFTRLRQIDGINNEFFRPEELEFLTSLHSNDNNRRTGWWPKICDFDSFNEIVIKPQGEKPNMEVAPLILEEHGQNSPQWSEFKKLEFEWKKWEKFNVEFNLPLSQSEAGENNESLVNITFQFHYIQTFFDKIIPKQSFKGTIQRFYRGYSMLLELLTSEVVQIVANNVGIGSILIHGGGRVTFLCPRGKKEKEILHQLDESKTKFLDLASIGKNESRIRSTLDKWAQACVHANQLCKNNAQHHEMNCEACNDGKCHDFLIREFCKDCLENERQKKQHPYQHDFKMWFKELSGFLPPISIRATSVRPTSLSNQELNEESILAEILKQSPEKVSWKDENCVLCCAKDFENNKINSIDGWMGLNNVEDSENITCSSHRLLYFLGHDQRLKDSALKKFEKMTKVEFDVEDGWCDDGTKNRTVTSICMLDANSLGVIFSERYWGMMNHNYLAFYDRQRRRSFQFNVYWWTSIFDSIEEFGKGDSIAAWITAGDDILLAQYQLVGKPQCQNLKHMIVDLAKKIHWKMDNDIFLSFGAGISVKKEGDRILELNKRAKSCESKSKEHWKQRALRDWERMTMLPPSPSNPNDSIKDGFFKDKSWKQKDHEDVFIGETRCTLIVDDTHGDENIINSNDAFRAKEYSIQGDIINSIRAIKADMNNIGVTIDFQTYVQRSYLERNLYSNENKFIILPPKLNSFQK
jgi:hypothetical protein